MHASYDHRILRSSQQASSPSSPEYRAFQTFIHYLGLKQHFMQADFVWNLNAKSLGRIDLHSFRKRKDQYYFYKLSEQSKREMQQRIISTMLYDSSLGIVQCVDMPDECQDFHNARIRTLSTLQSTLQKDFGIIYRNMLQSHQSLNQLCQIADGVAPGIYYLALDNGLSLEALAALDLIAPYSDQSSLSPLWELNKLRIRKYSLLLNLSREQLELLHQGLLQ